MRDEARYDAWIDRLRLETVLFEVDAADEPEVEDIRLDMYTKRAARLSDTEHLGEAQCLFFAERDGYPIATNDGRARARARASWDERTNAPRIAGKKKVDAFHIIEVLLVMIRAGTCRPGIAWSLYEKAVAGGLYESPGFEIPGVNGRGSCGMPARSRHWARRNERYGRTRGPTSDGLKPPRCQSTSFDSMRSGQGNGSRPETAHSGRAYSYQMLVSRTVRQLGRRGDPCVRRPAGSRGAPRRPHPIKCCAGRARDRVRGSRRRA